jgi:hypothetical protein
VYPPLSRRWASSVVLLLPTPRGPSGRHVGPTTHWRPRAAPLDVDRAPRARAAETRFVACRCLVGPLFPILPPALGDPTARDPRASLASGGTPAAPAPPSPHRTAKQARWQRQPRKYMPKSRGIVVCLPHGPEREPFKAHATARLTPSSPPTPPTPPSPSLASRGVLPFRVISSRPRLLHPPPPSTPPSPARSSSPPLPSAPHPDERARRPGPSQPDSHPLLPTRAELRALLARSAHGERRRRGPGRGWRGGPDAHVEGAREQQAPGAPPPRDRRQDLRRPPRARRLQAAQALRQQRGAQGALQRGRLGRRARRHHLPPGTPPPPPPLLCGPRRQISYLPAVPEPQLPPIRDLPPLDPPSIDPEACASLLAPWVGCLLYDGGV